jgi:hypothetical protein
LLEYPVQIRNAPSSLVSEGIANTALSVLATREDRVEIFASRLRRCGLSPVEAERPEAYTEAQRPLRRVRPNCILLAFQERRPDAETLAYSKRYRLVPKKRLK